MFEKFLVYKQKFSDLLDVLDEKYLVKIRKSYLFVLCCILILKLIF